jgi:ribosomal protein L37E
MIEDYSDAPGTRNQERVLLCVCCGKRVYVVAKKAAVEVAPSMAIQPR